MAEERDLAMVRAVETGDSEEVSKEELQRRMEEARESITQTVAEIKDTVANQYQAVKESVTEALDWREQFRKRPVVFSVGALSIGFIVGYSLAGAFVGDDEDDYRSYDDEDERRGRRKAAVGAPAPAARSYAAQAITGGAHGSYGQDTASLHESMPSATAAAPAPSTAAVYASPSAAPAQSSDAMTAEAEEDKGPGLIERFKGTKAYDRLEEEVSALGDRFLNELSKTAQTVVLPLLFSKVKDLFGVDLSNKEGDAGASQQQQPQRSAGSSAGGTTESNAALSGAAQSSFAGVNRGTATGSERASAAGGSSTGGSATGDSATGGSGTGASSYATSENRGYGASAGGGGSSSSSDYSRGSD